MRPLELRLTNFMAYTGPMELDLRGISLACLAGDNGAGKSTIIDAMTYALFGQSRAKSDNDLVHLGEEQMEVALDFALGDEVFRVIRQRDISGRGSSALEFQVSQNGQFRPLTGKSIRETQEAIIETIHLDYDTFTNSALLLQGRADEFTNQPPGKRKQILADILQLAEYDKLEEKAAERVREAELALAKLEAGAEEIDQELERKGEYESELAEAEMGVQTLGSDLEEAQGELDRKKERATGLSFKQQALNDVEEDLENQITEANLLASKIAHIKEHGLETWKRDEELGKLTQELTDLRFRIRKVDAELTHELQQQLEQVQTDLTDLEDLEDKRSTAEKAIKEMETEKASLTATNQRLREDMDALQTEIEILQRSGASCPLCDSELTEEHREEVLSQKKAEGKTKGDQYRENQEIIEEDSNELSAWEQELREIQKKLRHRELLRRQEAELTTAVVAGNAELDRLQEWKDRVTKIEQSMEDVKQRYREMAEQQITEAEEQVAKIETAIGELSAKRDTLRAELEGAEELNREIANLNAKITKLDAELNVARQKLGAATQKLEHCARLEQQKEERREEHQEASLRKAIYEELRTAFGKKGIQAMIIETVIPEIEEKANELLGRMTDGRMHVALESQREKKSGDGKIETLDIIVGDEQGDRPYDLFSGGEQFRINFALRVAISRVLARRAGAQLQTLIMDEGFGSQDAHGRSRLVEAIQSVAEDFAFILVITHVEELREQFPSQILVQKAQAGSLVTVN